MKQPILIILLVALAAAFTATAAPAQDVREASKKAEADRLAAEQRAHAIEEKIINDRSTLIAEVARLEARQKELENSIDGLVKGKAAKTDHRERLTDKWETREVEFKEISGNVRVAARDVEALLNQSPITALAPERLERVAPLLEAGYFPDISDISAMAGVLFDEMARSGEVRLQTGEFVGRDGEPTQGDILTLGKFTAMYRKDGEMGFLTYSPDTRKLFALSVLPERSMRRTMAKYFAGKSAEAPLDISSGGALRQITHKVSILEEYSLGGPIMWPIALIGLSVVIIAINKFIYLKRVHGDTDTIMGKVNDLAASGNWPGVDDIMKKHENHNWPVVNVIRDGIGARKEDRETLESVLQESILRELPRLERGMSVIAVFGAVAPLLGLLGTVTGMIATFRVITLYGTGDPKLMSGGISEALITTEWGLFVAIPTMLIHTFLSRRVNTIVGDMEEKAVTMTKIIQKEQRRGSVVASA
ncbi:MAG TPA: MotA/TolQ/ExbB proton channel family protein [Candidatus Krumholzibacteria bacterium]|nr:MotA/TolQ/ExbB proton channel family protein [Candidatus Krumholzibacteria bacterium]